MKSRKSISIPFLVFVFFAIIIGCTDDDPVPVFSDFFGTITDDVTGQPLEGAKVSAIGGDVEISDITDESGKFKLSNLRLSTYTLTVSRDGYVETVKTNRELLETSTQFDLALVPKGGVIGIVIDKQGQPLENVEVSLSLQGDLIDSDRTDALGQYGFTKLEPGRYRLNFKKEGYDVLNEELTVSNGAPEDFDKTLVKLASISGKIIDKEQDVFLEGAAVKLRGDFEDDAISSEFGDFSFNNLPDGTYILVVEAEGYEDDMEEDIVIESGAAVTRNFFLNPESPILKVTPEEIDFESELSNLPLTITNEGEGTMNWEIIENIDWLFVTPENDQTPPSETETVILRVDRSGLAPGEYSGQLTVRTDRSGSEVVGVKITVTGQLSAQPDVIDFGSDLVKEVVIIKNAGQGVLDFVAQPSHPWLRVTPSSGSADANGVELEITVERDGTPAGNHFGSVFISSNAGAENVSVKMLIPEPFRAQLTLSTEELDFGNQETLMPVDVINTGQQELDWTFVINNPWITVDPKPEDINDLQPGQVQELAVRIDRSQLPQGAIHQGSIDFNSDGGGARLDIFVSTQASAIISVSTDELDFGAALDKLIFRIENRGNEQLEWSIIPDQDWIIVPLSQGFDNRVVEIEVDRDLVTEGSSHSGNLRITSNGGDDVFVQVKMLTKSFPPDLGIGEIELFNENEDKAANPGESLSVRVPIVNSNEAEVGNANGVNVTISTDHPLLSSFPPVSYGLGTIRVGETKYVDFDLTIPAEMEFDKEIEFSVEIQDEDDNNWDEAFVLVIKPFLSNGLRELFNFDNQLFEEVLNGDIGLVIGATPSVDTPGGSGYSMSFDATRGDYLEIGRNLVRNYKLEATFSLWVKSTQQNSPMTLFHASQESNDRCVLEIVDENNIMVPSITFVKDVSTPLLDGEWHMLTVVLSESISKLYIDNALVNEDDQLHTLLQFSDLAEGWVFGRKGSESLKYFDGLMDNIRFYDRALTSPEIRLLFDYKN